MNCFLALKEITNLNAVHACMHQTLKCVTDQCKGKIKVKKVKVSLYKGDQCRGEQAKVKNYKSWCCSTLYWTLKSVTKILSGVIRVDVSEWKWEKKKKITNLDSVSRSTELWKVWPTKFSKFSSGSQLVICSLDLFKTISSKSSSNKSPRY